MSFAVPWALVGLAALPVLWWLARSRRRRPPVVLPSLLFVREEASAASPRRRALDLDLLLACLGAGSVALAAASPYVRATPAGRTVTVVRSGGASALARGQGEARAEVLEDLRRRLAPTDRLEVVDLPGMTGPEVLRPASGALLDAALARATGLGVVLSDLDPPAGFPRRLVWACAGVKDARNVGLVRAHLEPGPEHGGWRVFALVQASGAAEQEVGLEVEGAGEERVRLPARVLGDGAVASFEALLAAPASRIRLRVVDGDGAPWRDDLPFDDEVVFDQEPVVVRVGSGLATDVVRAFRLAAQASVGPEGLRMDGTVEGHALEIDGGGAPWRLLLPGTAGGPDRVFAGEGADVVSPDALVRDLSTRGSDLAYPRGLLSDAALGLGSRPGGPARDGSLPEVLLERVGARAWPVVLRRDRTVAFLPDPRAGRPPPIDTPLWPLFVENLLRVAAGTRTTEAPGWRVRGLLDPATSTLGRTRDAGTLWTAALAATPADRRAVDTPLQRPLALLGLLAWLGLWARGRDHAPARAVRSVA